MTTYTPQTDDLKHTLDDIVGAARASSTPACSPTVGRSRRAGAERGRPLCRRGDRAAEPGRRPHGCRLDAQTHAVTTAPGWKDAYGQWVEAGWGALPCPPEIGGQGLPILVSLAVQELWNTAASAFGIGTLLTQGAVEALRPRQRRSQAPLPAQHGIGALDRHHGH
jgi:alkylation response protein AidB-like acyl-CoA dehydrogenase